MEDEQEDDFDFRDYVVDYDKLSKMPGLLAVTRLFLAELKTNPYQSVGHFFKSLSDDDLRLLINIAESEMELEEGDTGQHSNQFGEIVLLAQMLSDAEGASDRTMTLSDVTKRTNQFVMFLTMESLYRKKLIKLYHQNMSFGEDADDKIVVEKL